MMVVLDVRVQRAALYTRDGKEKELLDKGGIIQYYDDG